MIHSFQYYCRLLGYANHTILFQKIFKSASEEWKQTSAKYKKSNRKALHVSSICPTFNSQLQYRCFRVQVFQLRRNWLATLISGDTPTGPIRLYWQPARKETERYWILHSNRPNSSFHFQVSIKCNRPRGFMQNVSARLWCWNQKLKPIKS